MAKDAAGNNFYMGLLQLVVLSVVGFIGSTSIELIRFKESTSSNRWTVMDHNKFAYEIDARLDKIEQAVGRGVPPPEVQKELADLRQQIRELRDELYKRRGAN